ncbi:MAG: hypothetical protein H0W36_05500 [Gemmatimonadetes bacterium]|nr:hypothetical protein [Gemmatimonadota bacterium]
MRRPAGSTPILWSCCLLIVAAACQKDQETVPAPPSEMVSVTGVTLGRAIGTDSRITEETETFSPTETIYVAVETTGTSPGATLGTRWTYEDGQLVDESSQTIAPDGPEVTQFHVSKPDGWPTGSYQVAITLNGAETGTEEFEVTAGAE